MSIPTKADIERVAEEALLCITTYGTPGGLNTPLDDRLSKAIRHYLIQTMLEVRNLTIADKRDQIQKLLDGLNNAAVI